MIGQGGGGGDGGDLIEKLAGGIGTLVVLVEMEGKCKAGSGL